VGSGFAGCVAGSVVPARLGLKAPALAWPEVALACLDDRPGQSRHSGTQGLARPRPRLVYVQKKIY
jgi:hypothetical protein